MVLFDYFHSRAGLPSAQHALEICGGEDRSWPVDRSCSRTERNRRSSLRSSEICRVHVLIRRLFSPRRPAPARGIFMTHRLDSLRRAAAVAFRHLAKLASCFSECKNSLRSKERCPDRSVGSASPEFDHPCGNRSGEISFAGASRSSRFRVAEPRDWAARRGSCAEGAAERTREWACPGPGCSGTGGGIPACLRLDARLAAD